MPPRPFRNLDRNQLVQALERQKGRVTQGGKHRAEDMVGIIQKRLSALRGEDAKGPVPIQPGHVGRTLSIDKDIAPPGGDPRNRLAALIAQRGTKPVDQVTPPDRYPAPTRPGGRRKPRTQTPPRPYIR